MLLPRKLLPWSHPTRALARRLIRTSSLSDPDDDPPFTRIPKHPVRAPPPPKPKAQATKIRPDEPAHSDLTFDFRYSYSETDPAWRPIGFREPTRFSPFGPGRLDRPWDGVAASRVEGDCGDGDGGEISEEEVLGEPLSEEEVAELVERYRHSDCSRQINLGKGGVTHNMLDDIHNHWKRADAVRIKCLGVPTLDMDNICFHLEDKTGGKIIYRNINILILYRGRNYDPKQRPVIPLMLWKPLAPIYSRLVQNVAEGLTFEETKELRNRGLNVPPLMKLTRNGVYVSVVDRVKEAFKTLEVVRLDCSHVGTSDCKKIGVKLRVEGERNLQNAKLIEFTNLSSNSRASQTPSFPTMGSFPEVKNNSSFGGSQTNGPPVFTSFSQIGAATHFGPGSRTTTPGVPTNTLFGQSTQPSPTPFAAPNFGSAEMKFGVPAFGSQKFARLEHVQHQQFSKVSCSLSAVSCLLCPAQRD